MKFFFTGVIALITCISVNAQEGLIYCEDALIAGKEFLYVKSNLSDNSTSQALNIQKELSSEDAPFIYIDENTLIYGRELLFVAPDPSPIITKKSATVKKETLTSEFELTENKNSKQEPISTLLAFPFTPSSSYTQSGNRSLAVLQPRCNGQQQVAKCCQKSTYQANNKSNLPLYLLEQKQKLSIAAIQCGTLTSFGSQSPPL